MSDEHYLVLGVPPTAPLNQVRTAYLRVVRASHPDVRPGDEYAADVTRRANAAWAAIVRERRGRDLPARRAAPAFAHRGTGAEGRAYRRAFHAACVRLAVTVFVGGLAVLLSLA